MGRTEARFSAAVRAVGCIRRPAASLISGKTNGSFSALRAKRVARQPAIALGRNSHKAVPTPSAQPHSFYI
jgi:hypothetical protein